MRRSLFWIIAQPLLFLGKLYSFPLLQDGVRIYAGWKSCVIYRVTVKHPLDPTAPWIFTRLRVGWSGITSSDWAGRPTGTSCYVLWSLYFVFGPFPSELVFPFLFLTITFLSWYYTVSYICWWGPGNAFLSPLHTHRALHGLISSFQQDVHTRWETKEA